MLRATLATLTVPLALAALTGCGAAQPTAQPTAQAESFAVPAGVQKQYEVLADELAEKGKTVESGEWTVNLITEAAEPWFEHGSHFRAPKDGETHHIEIIPTETSTGRIVPDVPITVAVIDAQGKVVQEMDLNFYYSTFYHYANNFSVPEVGKYTLRATLGVPSFNRHGDESDTPALAEGTTVEFAEVELTQE